jgi:hypothetical protein
MKNTIYIKRSTKNNYMRWAVVSPQGRTIGKGQVSIKRLSDINSVVNELKRDYHTTTAYQLLTVE